MFTLIYRVGEDWRRSVLPPGEIVVGRSPNSGLVLAHPSVSRRHAMLHVAPTSCRVTDLDSTQYTYVNGRRVASAELRDGDVVSFGQVSATVQESPDGVVVSDRGDAQAAVATELRSQLLKYSRVVAGEKAKPDDEIGRAARLIGLLAEATGALSRTRELSVILDRIAALIFEVVPAERVFVLLLDERSGDLVPRIARARDGGSAGAASISKTVTSLVMEEKSALLSTDVPLDPRVDGSESLMIQRVRSFMCAPLWTGQDVYGVIYVDTSHTARFGSSELDVFTTVCNYAAVAVQQSRLAAQLLEETRRRERLARYHSPAVADRIVHLQEGDESLVAQEREVTVVLADLVGFTPMTEQMMPNDVATLLNGFFTAMTEVIFEHEGTLDKFIGDAVLAVFGAPLDQPDHALRGVRAALRMREALRRLNARRTPVLEMRVAVNSGLALVGDIGAPQRREFTVLGDVVNTVARMQSELCAPGQVLISETTYREVQHAISAKPRGTATVTGRAGGVAIFEV